MNILLLERHMSYSCGAGFKPFLCFMVYCLFRLLPSLSFTYHFLNISIFVGAAQCLGELYKHFGRRITSGLLETTIIATKLIKFHEVVHSIYISIDIILFCFVFV
jgi:hypothetical protein